MISSHLANTHNRMLKVKSQDLFLQILFYNIESMMIS